MTAPGLSSLIERVEKATASSNELNIAIHHAVTGSRNLWRAYADSVDAALTLIDPTWERHVIKASTVNGVMVEIREPSEYGWTQGPPVYRGEHRCEAIAYCIAALKARLSSQQKEG